jgi:hypothetical protein
MYMYHELKPPYQIKDHHHHHAVITRPLLVRITKWPRLNVHGGANVDGIGHARELERCRECDVVVGDVSEEVEGVRPFSVRAVDVRLPRIPV